MNLQIHLLSRITVAALICLLATSGWVLLRHQQQISQNAQVSSDALVKQLEFQLLRINTGYQADKQFPDFDLWKQTSHTQGICLHYLPDAFGVERSLCSGIPVQTTNPPDWFDLGCRRFFHPGLILQRNIRFNGKNAGTLTISTDPELAIAQAWDAVSNLLGLSLVTILTVSVLLYWLISRALRPAQQIVNGLERIRHGDLAHRIPEFSLQEWAQTATAINQLAATQQQLLNERQQLLSKLINSQEEERHYLARELHDEFGQYLTGIQALAASISHSAGQTCPALQAEAQQIGSYTQTLHDSLKSLLQRLRPAELEELGLATALHSMLAAWHRINPDTLYHLQISGDCRQLSAALSLSLYRLIQEGITNIAKHAGAGNVEIDLAINSVNVCLRIADNGILGVLPLPGGSGLGVLGMRERVSALSGQFSLAVAQPHGLIIQISLPLNSGKADI